MNILKALAFAITLTACTKTPVEPPKPAVVVTDAATTSADGGQVDAKPAATPDLGAAKTK